MRRPLVAIFAAIFIICAPPSAAQAADEPPTTLTILYLDDSNGVTGQTTDELCAQMLNNAGVECSVHNAAVANIGCTYWPQHINALLALYQPDVVVFLCGTNDDARTATQRDTIGTAFRQVVEAVHTWRSPPIPVVVGWIQYSDPLLAPAWVIDSQPHLNDVLWLNMQYYVNVPGWFAGVADFQLIPSNATYLVDTIGPGDPGGIHVTPRGHRYRGGILYNSMRAFFGWPADPSWPLCDLYGHRRPYPRPTGYVPCLL